MNAIILREKDMQPEEYENLAKQVMDICVMNNVSCILHSFTDVAKKMSCEAIHLPMPVLRSLSVEERRRYKVIGASCHSVAEATEAEGLGCTYITAGHVFATDCKKGLKPRGLSFLENVCRAVSIPVYAIGGIDEKNLQSVIYAGVKGVCIMSGLMCCENPSEYIEKLRYGMNQLNIRK